MIMSDLSRHLTCINPRSRSHNTFGEMSSSHSSYKKPAPAELTCVPEELRLIETSDALDQLQTDSPDDHDPLQEEQGLIKTHDAIDPLQFQTDSLDGHGATIELNDILDQEQGCRKMLAGYQIKGIDPPLTPGGSTRSSFTIAPLNGTVKTIEEIESGSKLLFPRNRVFLSKHHLGDAINHFGICNFTVGQQSWAFECTYGPQHPPHYKRKKKSKPVDDIEDSESDIREPPKKRVRGPSTATLKHGCKYKINFQPVKNADGSKNKDGHVKITSTNHIHDKCVPTDPVNYQAIVEKSRLPFVDISETFSTTNKDHDEAANSNFEVFDNDMDDVHQESDEEGGMRLEESGSQAAGHISNMVEQDYTYSTLQAVFHRALQATARQDKTLRKATFAMMDEMQRVMNEKCNDSEMLAVQNVIEGMTSTFSDLNLSRNTAAHCEQDEATFRN